MEEQNKPNLQPIVAPGEAWHLAQSQAFERARQLVKQSIPDSPSDSVSNYAAALVVGLEGAADAAWRSFMSSADRPRLVAGRDTLEVQYDEARALPMVQWPAEASNSWGMVDVEEGEGGPGIVMAAPFRATDLEKLPVGTKTVKLRDPHHAATAALVEVLQCAARDAASAFYAPDAKVAWRRLNTIINIYRQSAQIGLLALKDDDYMGWDATLPTRFEIGSASGVICQVAATARAQRGVAVHLTSMWLQTLADAAEKEPVHARKEMFLRHLADVSEGVEQALAGMNLALAKSNWNQADPFDSMVVSNPMPTSTPVLVIIPRPTMSNVQPFKAKRRAAAR